MAEQIDVSARLDSAANRAEQAADILHAVANGGPADQVQTNNGPLPSVAKWMADKEAAFTAQAEAVLEPVTEQAGIAVAAAEAADADATRAEVAAEAAIATGKVYSDTTAGLAATMSGEYFSVLSAESAEYLILFRNESGTAAPKKTYPSTAATDELRSDLENRITPNDEFESPEALWRLVDDQGRIVATVELDGTLLAKLGVDIGVANGLSLARNPETGRYALSFGTEQGVIPIGACTASDTSGEYEDVLLQLLDNDGRLMLRVGEDGTFFAPKIQLPDNIPASTEVVEARGTTSALDNRLAPTIRPDGLSVSPLYGAEHFRETRRLLSALRSGAADTVLSIAALGDSWTDNRAHWIERLRAQLLGNYGSAGAGFVAPGRGSADGEVTITYSGFVPTNYISPSPHLLELVSSTAGHRVTVTAPSGADSALLYYRGDTGVVRARYNAGAWSANIALSGSGTQTVALPAPPDGAITLEIEVVSGNCVIYGVELRDSSSGIRWHKLGCGGSRASQWVAVDAAQWQAGIAAMAPRLVTLMLGTNDRYWYDIASFAGYIQTMIDRVRVAAPLADILLISPPENLDSTAPRSLIDYAYATRQIAAANRCAHLDLQGYFGALPVLDSYGDNGTGYILLADNVHPSPSGGGVLTEAIYRALLWS